MPLVRIEVRAGRSPGDKKALLDAVHRALVEALRIPDDDRTQRLYELDSEDFEIPPTRSGAFCLVEITMFPGRSREAKRHLYRAVVQKCRECRWVECRSSDQSARGILQPGVEP